MSSVQLGARAYAASVLVRIEKEGAFAAAALSQALGQARLGPKDSALATELTYGTLRVEAFLERELQKFAKKLPAQPEVKSHLLIAAYQIYFLDRIPPFAAVSEAVQELKNAGFFRQAAFANAVLRKLVEERSASSMEMDALFSQAILASTPSWLRKRLERELGKDVALQLLVRSRRPRPVLRFFQQEYPAWLEQETEATALPGAFTYLRGGDPRKHPEFERGEFVVQELGAQVLAAYAQPEPGERVLDVCAGRGHKTLLYAEAMREGAGNLDGELTAIDLYPEKLEALQEQAKLRGLQIETQAHDCTQPFPASWAERLWDRVIVDAPCTGLGTIHRRPEILRRTSSMDPLRLSELQLAILRTSLRQLAEGGLLFFMTCSVLDEEGEQVVRRLQQEVQEQGGELVLEENPAPPLRGAAWGGKLPDAPEQAQGLLSKRPASFRLLPPTDQTDGYFLARLRYRQKIPSE